MKTLITSALFIAQFMTNGTFAQEAGSPSNEALAQRISNEVREELGLTASSAFQLTCRITERNEGMAGTGSALVMYAPARVILAVEFTLVEGASDKALWTGTVYATGRSSMDEAVLSAAEQGAERVAKALPARSVQGAVNVVAQDH